MPISLDDYFVDRELTPKDEKGEYDYESLYALNLPLLNQPARRTFAEERRLNFPKLQLPVGKNASAADGACGSVRTRFS